MDIEENIILTPNRRLNKLAKYLNYNISTMVLFVLSFTGPIFLFFVILAAVLFTTYMLYVLIRENKKGWIIFFIILVIVPAVSLLILSDFYQIGKLLLLVPIALFYFYCFLLRHEVNEWVAELRARNQYMLSKMKKGENIF